MIKLLMEMRSVATTCIITVYIKKRASSYSHPLLKRWQFVKWTVPMYVYTRYQHNYYSLTAVSTQYKMCIQLQYYLGRLQNKNCLSLLPRVQYVCFEEIHSYFFSAAVILIKFSIHRLREPYNNNIIIIIITAVQCA